MPPLHPSMRVVPPNPYDAASETAWYLFMQSQFDTDSSHIDRNGEYGGIYADEDTMTGFATETSGDGDYHHTGETYDTIALNTRELRWID